jgi:cob(I)alamin adenosyltransferase
MRKLKKFKIDIVLPPLKIVTTIFHLNPLINDKMRIYTKTGDKGDTELYGKKISKDECRIGALGDVDELNSHIGFVRSLVGDKEIDNILEGVQEGLFLLGADIAAQKKALTEKHIKSLEEIIERLNQELKPLRRFILPTGTQVAAALHVARSVCRRAERSVVRLSKKEQINEFIIQYLNRLSDLLFILARYTNSKSGIKEKEWRIK